MQADALDTRFLESLVGYNARRAALTIIETFVQDMSVHGFRPVDFSVMSVIKDNPGVTSRQLCAALNILPPIWWASSRPWKSAASSSAAPTPAMAEPWPCTPPPKAWC